MSTNISKQKREAGTEMRENFGRRAASMQGEAAAYGQVLLPLPKR